MNDENDRRSVTGGGHDSNLLFLDTIVHVQHADVGNNRIGKDSLMQRMRPVTLNHLPNSFVFPKNRLDNGECQRVLLVIIVYIP